MDKAKSSRIRELCSLINIEKDPQKFLGLVLQLNHLLSEKDVIPQSGVPHHDNH